MHKDTHISNGCWCQSAACEWLCDIRCSHSDCHVLPCDAAGGLDAYVVVPNKPYTAAVVLVTDIFGYKTEGIRRWADKLADAVSPAVHAEHITLHTTHPSWTSGRLAVSDLVS